MRWNTPCTTKWGMRSMLARNRNRRSDECSSSWQTSNGKMPSESRPSLLRLIEKRRISSSHLSEKRQNWTRWEDQFNSVFFVELRFLSSVRSWSTVPPKNVDRKAYQWHPHSFICWITSTLVLKCYGTQEKNYIFPQN